MPAFWADKRIRGAIIGVASTAVILILTQFVFPGGPQGNGTPIAVLFQGTVFGSLAALLAVGIVLIYRSHRIINFAQAALGLAGAVLAYNLVVLANWPYFLAFVAGMLVAAGTGILFELSFVRRFFESPRLVLTVITIALIPALGAVTGFVIALPIFGNPLDRSQEELIGTATMPLPFDSWEFSIGRFPLSFGFEHLWTVALAAVALVGLAAFFRYSRLGVAIRAAAENAERAQLLGIGIGMLSMVSWTIASLLSGLGAILQTTVQRRAAIGVVEPELLIVPLAAAVLGRMRSFPVAALSAIGITVVREAVRFSWQQQTAIPDVALVVLILVALFVQRERRSRSEAEEESSSWQAVEEPRAIPKEMMDLTAVRVWRRIGIGIVVAAVLLVPWVGTIRQTNLLGRLLIVGIVFLSLVVLTGWAGQASLGQYGLVAFGAVIGGSLTSRVGLSFWIAVLLTPVIVAGLSLLVGLPALRIRGLFLAVVTLAFAFAVHRGLFNEAWFGWLLPEKVNRPSLFLIDFDEERSMFYLSAVALGLAMLLVWSLRRSRPGRVLIALRDNEANVQAFGINPLRMRLAAFGLSGFLCGFAGVMLAHHQRAVVADEFVASNSMQAFLFAVIGGVGSIPGVLIGAAYSEVGQFISNPITGFVIGPMGIVFLLYVAPGGVASLLTSFRDGILRIVAQRRQMVVPSLFADYDPAMLERQLIPLDEASPGAGLGALRYDQRYRTESGLYGGRGRFADGRRRSDETAAIGAAAQSFGEDDEAMSLARDGAGTPGDLNE